MVVSLHDVAPATAELSRRWLALLEEVGIRATLLVVPGTWRGQSIDQSPKFVDWVKSAQERGHEVAQHGFSHQRHLGSETNWKRELVGGLLARGAEEFWHLSYGRATELLMAGHSLFDSVGITTDGFVAPGWLMSPDAMTAAQRLGYRYTCTHQYIECLQENSRIFAPTTSQRPNSYLTRPTKVFNQLLISACASRLPVLRIGIHPADLVNVRLRNANLDLCKTLMIRGYRSTTYHDLVVSSSHQGMNKTLQ